MSSAPSPTQEGNTVFLTLTVSGISSTTAIQYQFRFNVKDPASVTYQSQLQNYTTYPGQTQFYITVAFPSNPSFPGKNSFVGQYSASVDQMLPSPMLGVATSNFYLGLTDASEYQRTQTVNIQASGYNASELVTVNIRTLTTSTLVFSRQVNASPSGIVITSWDIPVNATIDTYTLTLTGTNTVKTPADSQRFLVNPAVVTIAAITSVKSTYQRTDSMMFSFQPKYPDGTIPSTGAGVLNLMNPNRKNMTLTATYSVGSQTFNATYSTSATSLVGTWVATLFSHSYSDGYGNSGPSAKVSSSPSLAIATLTVSVLTNTNFLLGQLTKFNATVTYPDGTAVTSGTVSAYLLYSGTPVINDSIPLVYDTGLGLWVGSYTPKPSDTGGLWSLIFKASDSSTPADTGSATRAITLQNNTTQSSNPSNNTSLPLYLYGIIAALIAGLLIATVLAFKRRKVTHARLKIDLEAVRSEAGRIESQDFFKSIKDQVAKNEEPNST